MAIRKPPFINFQHFAATFMSPDEMGGRLSQFPHWLDRKSMQREGEHGIESDGCNLNLFTYKN